MFVYYYFLYRRQGWKPALAACAAICWDDWWATFDKEGYPTKLCPSKYL